jgi:hypothetical protein
MPPNPAVHQFIDFGDSTSRNATPSSIGEYDLADDFIDDDVEPDSQHSSPLFCSPWEEVRQTIEPDRDHGGQSQSPGSTGSSGSSPLLHVRRTSSNGPLRNGPSLQRVHGGRAHMSDREHRLHALSANASPLSTWSIISPVGSVRGSASGSPATLQIPKPRKRHRELSASTRSSLESEPLHFKRLRIRQSAASVVSDISARSQFTPNRLSVGEASSRAGSVLSQSASRRNQRELSAKEHTNPFEFPDHLALELLKGVGLPGKRLGNGRPRWSNRYFLITSSQCGYDWPWKEIITRCELLGAKHRIGREFHGDGGYHYHCFLDFERKIDFENIHKFCVGKRKPPRDGEEVSTCPGVHHVNILAYTKTFENGWDYAGKDGDVVSCNMDRPIPRGSHTTKDDMWTASYALPTKVEFLADIKRHSSRDFALFGNQVHAAADREYGNGHEPTIQDNTALGLTIHWERYEAVRKWFVKVFPNPMPIIKATSAPNTYTPEQEEEDLRFLAERGNVKPRPPSLILYGASRLGKSDFAAALGPHVQFRGQCNMSDLNDVGVENVDYLIWDDVGWDDAGLKDGRYKCWLGGQPRFVITDKFLKKKTIDWNKPCIYLSNDNPLWTSKSTDTDWLNENCVIVDVGDKTGARSTAISSGTVYTNNHVAPTNEPVNDYPSPPRFAGFEVGSSSPASP